MNLKETTKLRQSDDYKERFKAECLQLKIHKEKLQATLEKKSRGKLPFAMSNPAYLLEQQVQTIPRYMETLEARAFIEKVS